MSLFEQITALIALEAAWGRVRENGGAAGGDGESVAEFDAQAPTRLLALHRALRSGRYHPGPHRVVPIPKRSGGVRPLSIPCVADRVVHTAIAQALTPMLDRGMADGSFGYRPGRSVRTVRYGWAATDAARSSAPMNTGWTGQSAARAPAARWCGGA